MQWADTGTELLEPKEESRKLQSKLRGSDKTGVQTTNIDALLFSETLSEFQSCWTELGRSVSCFIPRDPRKQREQEHLQCRDQILKPELYF